MSPICSTVSFYIIAHADDWQLFMNPEVLRDLNNPAKKVVFIVTTAGDAGRGSLFWKAREEGMKSSIRFCRRIISRERTAIKKVREFHFNYCALDDVTCYFMRLPDGGLSGDGFISNNHQSMSRFQCGDIKQLTSLDGLVQFSSWERFCEAIEALIAGEAGRECVDINYLNPDRIANPGDHPDHQATGAALKQVSGNNRNVTLFAGYGNSFSYLLSADDIFWKSGMFAVYDRVVYDASGYSTVNENPQLYSKWCTMHSETIRP